MSEQPNIVVFFVDDMGYGDVSCLNPDGRIATPHFDRLAAEGMCCTDAHSTSAVCSPSRYSLLTGRYNWRSPLQRGIVQPYGDPLIAADRLTLPKLLSQAGYHSACIGKWHLGMGWDFPADERVLPGDDLVTDALSVPDTALQDYWAECFAKPTFGGPQQAGFSESFGVDVPNWPPYCYIENGQPLAAPSAWLPPRLLAKNLASKQGPAMPHWHFEQLLPDFAARAERYIETRVQNDEPFFLYLPMTSPHTPLSVNKEWIGRSGLNNLYADLVMETDAVFGRVLDALDAHGISDNTLVVFTSDNGCAPYIGVEQMEAQGHYPSGPYRGYKSDAWDGGHRVPFIARWPNRIAAGSQSQSLVSLSDVMATCADIISAPLPADAAEDSVSLLPLFADGSATVRDSLVHHSIHGKFAIRDERWKLVLCPGSGGWTLPDAKACKQDLPVVQLYDMQADPGEQNNLHRQQPEQVSRLLGLLQEQVAAGRSTPGPQQRNDAEVDIWKWDTLPGRSAEELDDY